ncbi:hypothetical protein [Aggregatibacter actinomycetemcomitans]|uniref:hypothetical protein n=1 Tax=Aggregatibacter actinomycetemcomitans TaxID=714 RepID=UPI001F11D3A0|nr:hypothetical protein [Aggregatibacter actinomycetemcomitans]
MHLFAIQIKSIIAEVFARFGVILIFICPMQHHFFTRIRNGVSVVFIAALANKIAVVVITGKESEKMVINCRFLLGIARQCGLNFLRKCGFKKDSNFRCAGI